MRDTVQEGGRRKEKGAGKWSDDTDDCPENNSSYDDYMTEISLNHIMLSDCKGISSI